MTRRILSLLLCIALTVSGLPVAALAQEEHLHSFENGVCLACGEAEAAPEIPEEVPEELVVAEEYVEETEAEDIPEEEPEVLELVESDTAEAAQAEEEAPASDSQLELIQKHEQNAMFVGGTIQLTVQGTEETALTWSSSDQSVATVDQTGVVTGQGCGEAEITVTAGDASASYTVMVFLEETAASMSARMAEVPRLAGGLCDDGLKWYIDINYTLVISVASGDGVMKNYWGQYDQPWVGGDGDNYYNRVRKIVVEEGVTVLGEYAFWPFMKVTEVSLPSTLTTIRYCAFASCTALTSITIPASVTSIAGNAFRQCTKLTDIEFLHTAEDTLTIQSNTAFNPYYNTTTSQTAVPTTIYVPDATNIHSAISGLNWAGVYRSPVTYKSTDFPGIYDLFITNNTNPQIEVGQQRQLEVTYKPDHALANLEWSVTSRGGQATIDSNGVLTGVAPGGITVTVKAKGGTASCEITMSVVEATAKVSAITIASENPVVEEAPLNTPIQLTAQVSPGNAVEKDVVWSVENGTGEASITEDGVLTGTAEGTVTVKAAATDGSGVVGEQEISIVKYVESITILVNGREDVTTIGIDEVAMLSAKLSPSDATLTDVYWYVEPGTGCAEKDQYYYLDGTYLTGTKPGTITVIAYAGDNSGVQGKISLTVAGEKAAYPVEGGNIYYNTATGAIVGADYEVTSAVIPSKIGDTTITSIAPFAFLGSYNYEAGHRATDVVPPVLGHWTDHLKSVTIPSTVTHIDKHAFYGCREMTEVILEGNNLRTIGEYAFYNCKSLTSLPVPEGVTSIGAHAFDCNADGERFLVDSFTLPKSVSYVGEQAFAVDFNSLTIAAENPDYATRAFWCLNLKELTISGAVDFEDWLDYGTYGWEPLDKLTLTGTVAAGPAYDPEGDNTFVEGFRGRNAKTVVLADTITTIEPYAFARSGYTEEILFEGDVQVISEGAFQYSHVLPEITLPEGTTYIGNDAFIGCPELQGVTIPAGVSYIGDRAFAYCHNLTEFNLSGESQTAMTIGSNVIQASAVSTITIPANVTVIREAAFEAVEALQNITFLHQPTDPLTIGARAFYLSGEGSIPTVVKAISLESANPAIEGYDWDQDQGRQTTLKLYRGWGDIHDTMRWELGVDNVLHIIGTGEMPDYDAGNPAPWYDLREYVEEAEIGEGVTYLGSYALADTRALKAVRLPESLTGIGLSCFTGSGCTTVIDLSGNPEKLPQEEYTFTYTLPAALANNEDTELTWYLASTASQELVTLEETTGTLRVLEPGTVMVGCVDKYTGARGMWTGKVGTAVTVSAPESYIIGGGKLQLTAYLHPEDIQTNAVIWTVTEGSDIAQVSAKGLVTTDETESLQKITVTAVPVDGGKAGSIRLNVLPKTTQILLSPEEGGEAVTKLTVDMQPSRTMTLYPQVQPAGALEKLTWKSSNDKIASVQDGVVTLKKPGTATITATAKDGTKKAASVKLTVIFLDTASKLTAAAQVPSIGLQEMDSTTMEVFGTDKENAIAPEYLKFTSSDADMATVDAYGTITAGAKPGTVTITAAIADDPLSRKISVKVKVIAAQTEVLTLIPEEKEPAERVMLDSDGKETLEPENAVHCQVLLDKQDLQEGAYTFTVTPNAINTIGEPSKTGYKWSSGDTRLATVKGNSDGTATVTVKARTDGSCVINAVTTDYAKVESSMTVVVRDYAPRLESGSLTLNPKQTAGVQTALVESYGNTIAEDGVTIADSRLKAQWSDGILTITANEAIKNSTIKTQLLVQTDKYEEPYVFDLKVKVANSTPAITVKQSGKFNLFYTDSTATITVTAKNAAVTDVAVKNAEDEAEDFALAGFDADTGTDVITYSEAYLEGEDYPTADKKLTLLVSLEGYEEPVEKTITLSTVTTKPKLALSGTASTVNTALAQAPQTTFYVYDKSTGEIYDLTEGDVTIGADFAESLVNGDITLELTGTSGGKANIWVQCSNWTDSVKLTHKVSVQTKLPTAKAGKLTLSRVFTHREAVADVSLNQSNLEIGYFDFVPKAKKNTTQSYKILLEYSDGQITAKFRDPDDAPSAGTYSYTAVPYLTDDTPLNPITVTVSVNTTAPKVKFSATTLKLNKYLLGVEEVSATVTAGDYQVVGIKELSDIDVVDLSFADGVLTASLSDPDAAKKTHTISLTPIVLDPDTGREAALSSVKVKVQIYESNKLSVSLSAKGKLDTMNPKSAIVYTVKKFSNVAGKLDNVWLEGEDKDLFRVEANEAGTQVTLTMEDRDQYVTNKTYALKLVFSISGQEVASTIRFKVSQTALKFQSIKTLNLYQSDSRPLTTTLALASPATAVLENVELSDRTDARFRKALGEMKVEPAQDGRSAEITFVMENPGYLTYGKSYAVWLEVTPVNMAANTKPVQVKLNVKVSK